jgi:hypothetical protein
MVYCARCSNHSQHGKKIKIIQEAVIPKHDPLNSFTTSLPYQKVSMCKGKLIYETVYKIHLPLGKLLGQNLALHNHYEIQITM